jgi:hypothetical protein
VFTAEVEATVADMATEALPNTADAFVTAVEVFAVFETVNVPVPVLVFVQSVPAWPTAFTLKLPDGVVPIVVTVNVADLVEEFVADKVEGLKLPEDPAGPPE